MPINIYSVRNHLEENGWKLVSDTYKNLDTELEMICPKGHRQKQTYKQWRKRPMCEKCVAGNTNKVQKNKVPIKTIDTQRILALDAATGTTGYSIYDDGVLVSYGTYKTDSTQDTTTRINEVKKWLKTIIDDYEIDFIGLEDIQYQKNIEIYKALAKLQGVLIDVIFEACIDHALAYSTEWRKYCGVGEGTGRENKKKQAQDKVKLWYGQDCTQDEADAICIGKYFVHILKQKKSSWGENFD